MYEKISNLWRKNPVMNLHKLVRNNSSLIPRSMNLSLVLLYRNEPSRTYKREEEHAADVNDGNGSGNAEE